MAQFTVQGRLKLLFNNDGTHCKLLGNDFLGGLRSSQTQKRKIRSLGANCTKLYAAASLSKKSKHFYTVASQSVSEASDEDYDSERDELACFRGLVLDISYRYLISLYLHDCKHLLIFTCVCIDLLIVCLTWFIILIWIFLSVFWLVFFFLYIYLICWLGSSIN
jgi:hypothetical protein